MELIEGGSLNSLLNDPFGLLSALQKYDEMINQINVAKQFKTPQKEIEKLERKRNEIESKLIHKSIKTNLQPIINSIINCANQFLQNPSRETHQPYMDESNKLEMEYKLKFVNQKLDNKQIIDLAIKIAKAIEYMHSRQPPVIHRDLKSENVMICGDLETLAINEVKVADLGLATFMHGQLRAINNPVGTIPFTAPEIFDSQQSYSTQSDVYSFAIGLFLFLLIGF